MRMPPPSRLIGSNQSSLLTPQPHGGNVLQTQPQQILAMPKTVSRVQHDIDVENAVYVLRDAKDAYNDLKFMPGEKQALADNYQLVLDVAEEKVRRLIYDIIVKFIGACEGDELKEGVVYPVYWLGVRLFVLHHPLKIRKGLLQLDHKIVIS